MRGPQENWYWYALLTRRSYLSSKPHQLALAPPRFQQQARWRRPAGQAARYEAPGLRFQQQAQLQPHSDVQGARYKAPPRSQQQAQLHPGVQGARGYEGPGPRPAAAAPPSPATSSRPS